MKTVLEFTQPICTGAKLEADGSRKRTPDGFVLILRCRENNGMTHKYMAVILLQKSRIG